MKFKRCISAICSSALVLGLSFLLYPQPFGSAGTAVSPTGSVAPTASPSPDNPIENPVPGQTGTESPKPTTAPTATPEIPFYSLLTGNLNTPLSGISDLVTAYINA